VVRTIPERQALGHFLYGVTALINVLPKFTMIRPMLLRRLSSADPLGVLDAPDTEGGGTSLPDVLVAFTITVVVRTDERL